MRGVKEVSKTKIDVRMDVIEYLSYFIAPFLLIFSMWQFERTGTMLPMLWIAYALIPLLDYISPLDIKNRTPEEYEVLEKDWRYNIPLYTIWAADLYTKIWGFNLIYYRGSEIPWIELFFLVSAIAVGTGIGQAAGH